MKDLVIIGGGSSVKEGIELGLWDKIKDIEIWSLNFAFIFMPYLPKREIWVDVSFFKKNLDRLESIYRSGTELHCSSHALYNNYSMIKQYQIFKDVRHFEDNEKYFSGKLGFVGVFALSIAVREQYDRIFLLGYDFGVQNPSSNDTHFYQHMTKECNIVSVGVGNPRVYMDTGTNKVKSIVEEFSVYNKHRDKIYNVSTISNIKEFQKISYQSFFDLINRGNNAN